MAKSVKLKFSFKKSKNILILIITLIKNSPEPTDVVNLVLCSGINEASTKAHIVKKEPNKKGGPLII